MKKIIGIIGSKEKRIVSSMTNQMFKNAGYSSRVISSLNLEKQMVMDKNNIEKIDILIIEIDRLSIDSIIKNEIDLDIIVEIDLFLEKNRDDNYYDNKIKLVQTLKKDKLLVINTDYKESIKLAYKNKEAMIMTYGLNGRSSLTVSSLDIDVNTKLNFCLQRTIKTLFGSYIEPFEYPIEVNLIGIDNLYCTFAAISVALHFNLELETIVKTFLSLEGKTMKVI